MDKNKSKSSMMSLFIKGSAALVVSNICLKALNFFLLPLYTKNLTPKMIGISDTITTFVGLIFPLLVMGFDSAYSAFYFDDKDSNRSKKVFNTIFMLMAVMGIIPILGCIFSKPISLLLFNEDIYYKAVIITLISVSCNLWYLPFSLELRLQNKMSLFGAINVISSFIMILLNVLFVSILKLGIYSLILSTFITQGILLLIYFIVSKSKFDRKMFDKALLKSMFFFAVPLVPMSIASWILNLSDRYIILHYCGAQQVGIYGIGGRFITVLNVFITSVSTAYVTFAFGTKNDKNAKKQYYNVFNVMYVILIAISFTISIFGKEIVYLMTSPEYFKAYLLLRDMMFSQTVYGLISIVSYGFFFKKKSVYSLIATSVAAVFNIVFNIIFIPKYGIVAASLTTLIGYVLSFIISYHFSQKFYQCNYGRERVGISFVILYFVALIFRESNLTIKIVVWMISAGCTLFIFRKFLKQIISFLLSKVINRNKKEADKI